MGGRISMIVESIGALWGAMQGGSIRALAVASSKRLPNFPDLPTATETVPGLEAMGWFVLLAPAGTPEPIVASGEQGPTACPRPAGAAQKLPGSRHIRAADVACGNIAVHPQ